MIAHFTGGRFDGEKQQMLAHFPPLTIWLTDGEDCGLDGCKARTHGWNYPRSGGERYLLVDVNGREAAYYEHEDLEPPDVGTEVTEEEAVLA